jgi:hypothetical protein
VAQRAARRTSISSAAVPRWAAVALLALRAVATGANPYDNGVAITTDRALDYHPAPPPPGGRYEHTFNYLLPPALVLLPLIALDDDTAIIVMRALTVALYLMALALLVWRFGGRLPVWGQGGLLIAGIGWWPFLAVILPIVQQAGTVFGLLVLAAFGVERKRWFAAGVLSFLALLKPTESIVLVAVLALWALRSPSRQAWRYFGGMGAIGIPTSLLAFALRPTWVTDWWNAVVALQRTHFDYEVDPPTPLAGVLRLPPGIIWAAAALVGIALAVWCWRSLAALAQQDRRMASTGGWGWRP